MERLYVVKFFFLLHWTVTFISYISLAFYCVVTVFSDNFIHHIILTDHYMRNLKHISKKHGMPSGFKLQNIYFTGICNTFYNIQMVLGNRLQYSVPFFLMVLFLLWTFWVECAAFASPVCLITPYACLLACFFLWTSVNITLYLSYGAFTLYIS